MTLLSLALAPVLLLLSYVYFRDKYEKEPLPILALCFFCGAISSFPIIALELFLKGGWVKAGLPAEGLGHAAFKSFLVAAFSEELFKFLAVTFLIWRSREFNERFDGIVYAVFVSLGFAAVENLLYVFSQGAGVGWLRMFTAVPGHAVFGITMGYFIGLAKFTPEKRNNYLILGLLMPIALHGFYNFILYSKIPVMLLIFIPYLVVLFRQSNVLMKAHVDQSELAKGQRVAALNPEELS